MNQIKYAFRSLSKTPGVTFIAVLTLSLGIGASVAMFSLMNSLLLRPLAFADSQQLIRVQRTGHKFNEGSISPADFLDLTAAQKEIGRFAAYAYAGSSLAQPGQPAEYQNSLRVSADFFDILGAKAELGRTFRAGEDVAGNHRLIVLTHPLWVNQFGADPAIVGKTVRLDGEGHEVVGVLSAPASDRRLYGNATLFRPLVFNEKERTARNMLWLNVLGRPANGVSFGQASAFVQSMGQRLAKDFPTENKDTGWRARGLLDSTMKPTGRILVMMLVGLAAFVLLIACSNLANLLLARAMGRAREFALRAALGASRRQLVIPVACEALILAVAGGAGALLVSSWASDWLRGRVSEAGEVMDLSLDWRVLGFAFAISAATVLFFGIAPALFAARVSLEEALKKGNRTSSASSGQRRLRSALVIAQFGLAMTLLAGAAFFVRGANRALEADNGWSADQVLQGSIHLPKGYRADSELNVMLDQLLERLENITGIESAALSYGLPYRGLNNHRSYRVDGRDTAKGQELHALANGISADYFKVTATRLLAGRAFNKNDGRGAQHVAIISESMARALFQNENPLGRRIAMAGSEAPEWDEIVGVVADVQPVDVAQAPIRFQVYEPIGQDHWYYGEGKLVPICVSVRASRVAPESLTAAVRAAAAGVDPDLPIRELMSANAMIARFSSQFIVIKQLLSAFAAVGIFLAALGVYGVLTRIVTQRTFEIGIRMALGASARKTIRLVVSAGLKLALAGAGIGLLGAFAVGKMIASALPGMQTDPGLTLSLGTIGMAAVALVACYLPARRAARINPIIALRVD